MNIHFIKRETCQGIRKTWKSEVQYYCLNFNGCNMLGTEIIIITQKYENVRIFKPHLTFKLIFLFPGS